VRVAWDLRAPGGSRKSETLLQAIAPTPAAAAKLSVSRIAAASRRAGRSRGMDQAAAEIKAQFSSKRPPTIQTLLASDDGYATKQKPNRAETHDAVIARTSDVSATLCTGSHEQMRFGERLIGGNGDGRALFSLGENLKQQFRSASVQLQIPELSSQESGAATLDFCRI